MTTPSSTLALPRPRVLRVIGKQQSGEVPTPYRRDPFDPYRYSYLTRFARTWTAGLAPRDAYPFSCIERSAAQATGLTLDVFRKGGALLDRAPAPLLALWNAEEVQTCNAYAVMVALELPGSGRLAPVARGQA
jgi:hypothetical protein